MVLFNVQIQEPVCREVFTALGTPIDMRLHVMDLVVFVGIEGEGVSMGR